MRLKTVATALACALICGLTTGVSAQDYCVTCTGPDAKYRCVIGGNASPAARSSRGQLLCITQLAQSGGHASCSVSRTTSDPCEGQVRTVMFPAGEADAPQVTETPPPAVPAQAAAAPPPAQPPALTEGAAPPPPPSPAPQPAPSAVGQIAKDSAEGLKKAGDTVTKTVETTGQAIGHAASKTWKCLISFFGDC